MPLTTGQAKYILGWFSWLARIMIIGYTLIDLGRFARMPPEVTRALTALVSAVVVGMAITMIVQKRAVVSARLRGPQRSAAQLDADAEYAPLAGAALACAGHRLSGDRFRRNA